MEEVTKQKIVALTAPLWEKVEALQKEYNDIGPEYDEGWFFSTAVGTAYEDIDNQVLIDGAEFYCESWDWLTIEDLYTKKFISEENFNEMQRHFDVADRCREFLTKNAKIFEDYEKAVDEIVGEEGYSVEYEEWLCFFKPTVDGKPEIRTVRFPEEMESFEVVA